MKTIFAVLALLCVAAVPAFGQERDLINRVKHLESVVAAQQKVIDALTQTKAATPITAAVCADGSCGAAAGSCGAAAGSCGSSGGVVSRVATRVRSVWYPGKFMGR